jgi:hypothetical protein
VLPLAVGLRVDVNTKPLFVSYVLQIVVEITVGSTDGHIKETRLHSGWQRLGSVSAIPQ